MTHTSGVTNILYCWSLSTEHWTGAM